MARDGGLDVGIVVGTEFAGVPQPDNTSDIIVKHVRLKILNRLPLFFLAMSVPPSSGHNIVLLSILETLSS